MSSVRVPSPDMFSTTESMDELYIGHTEENARIVELEQEVTDLKYLYGNAQLAADEYKKLYEKVCDMSGIDSTFTIRQATKILDLEQDVESLKRMLEQARVSSNEYEQLYEDACDYSRRESLEFRNQMFRIKELEKENVKLIEMNRAFHKTDSDFELQIKSLLEINADLEKKLSTPPTMQRAFKQLRAAMNTFQIVYDELLAKYGSSKAVEAAGVWDTPEYKDYSFNYVDELGDIYNTFMPIVHR
jgi:hypothetical protein